MNRIPPLLALVCVTALSFGCGDDDPPCPDGALFTHHAVDPDSVMNVEPLGNINPPGHTFPSDHGGYYIANEPGTGTTYRVNLYAPGDLPIESLLAVEHVTAGLTDYEIDFRWCDDVWGLMGHVTSLDPDLFGNTADHTQWDLEDEYSTGGETYRRWRKNVTMTVEAGALLGTVGGNPGQGGLDFNMYDRRGDLPTPANPARWSGYGFLAAKHFLEFYEDGAVLDELDALVNREEFPNDTNPYGYVMQDVPGTAHGAWFRPGHPNIPEDPHLGLLWGHWSPWRATVSVGTTLTGCDSGAYGFDPVQTGRLNRAFDEIEPDGQTYAFIPDWPAITFILTMPDEETVWIEKLDGEHPDPADWIFSDAKVEYVR